jgi:hypothetical protein
MKKYTLLCVVLLSGCTSVASTLSGSSSGVLPYKDNSFMISTGNAVPSSAQKQAYEEAMEFCKENNKSRTSINLTACTAGGSTRSLC